MFSTGDPAYPVERTLLTTGITEAVMQSRHRQGAVQETPHLEFSYRPTNFGPFREDGSSWELRGYDIPEPPGIEPLGSLVLTAP